MPWTFWSWDTFWSHILAQFFFLFYKYIWPRNSSPHLLPPPPPPSYLIKRNGWVENSHFYTYRSKKAPNNTSLITVYRLSVRCPFSFPNKKVPALLCPYNPPWVTSRVILDIPVAPEAGFGCTMQSWWGMDLLLIGTYSTATCRYASINIISVYLSIHVN